MTCSLNNLRNELESLQILANDMLNRENERKKEMLNMSAAYKDGKDAFLQGMQLNRNPYLNQKGAINDAMRMAWESGFKKAQLEASGV